MIRLGLCLAVLTLLGACSSYDYLQRTDRVGYSHGDAVRANLEMQTLNPSGAARYSTAGLGRNGQVLPASPSGGMTAQDPSAAANEQ